MEPPYNWRSDTSGQIQEAIHAYRAQLELNGLQIFIIVDYLSHWVLAPCWDMLVFEMDLKRLRLSVHSLSTVEEIHAWVQKAMDLGMNPL